MHHLHIISRGEGQLGEGFALAKYTPGQGYSLMCDRAELAEYLQSQEPEETPHMLVIITDDSQPAKGEVTTRSAPTKAEQRVTQAENPDDADKTEQGDKEGGRLPGGRLPGDREPGSRLPGDRPGRKS